MRNRTPEALHLSGRTALAAVGLLLVMVLLLALPVKPAQANHSVCEFDPELGRNICIPGLHAAPDITVNNASVSAFDGRPATNSGTYDDTLDDDADTVSLTASVGTVTKSGTDSGTWSWSLPNANPPGSRSVIITATDSTGRSRSVSFTLNVINESPGVGLNSPTGGALLRGTATLSAGASDPSGVNRVEFLVNGVVVGQDTTAPYSIAWDSATVGDGGKTVTARAFDVWGNSATSASRSVTVDNTPPSVSVISGPSGTVNSASATFEFSASDAASGLGSVQCSLDGAPFAACTSPHSLSSLPEGQHTFSVRATDNAGNVSSAASRTWTVDAAVPSAPVITAPAQGSRINSASFAVKGTAEPGSTVELFEGTASRGTATAASSGSWSVTLSGVANGSHTYTARATDAVGNTSSASAARTVIVDTARPSVTVVSPPNLKKNISPATNVTATFSEAMRASTLNKATVKLVRKGMTKPIAATISYSAKTRKVTLNPSRNLVRGATYTATVTTGAKDLAGNPLAKSKVWRFTVKR